MDEKTYVSLKIVIDYLEETERKDWEENGKPESHIYTHIKQVADWVRNY